MRASPRARGPTFMRGGPEYVARIKCAGRGGPARGVRALCGAGLNGAGRPALPSLVNGDM